MPAQGFSPGFNGRYPICPVRATDRGRDTPSRVALSDRSPDSTKPRAEALG
jgi:hypothetical protein